MISRTPELSGGNLKRKVIKNPHLTVTKIGIVSRDYQRRYENGRRDFSFALPKILELLDRENCDTVLFSSYSIVPRESFKPFNSLQTHNIKSVFYEEFRDGKIREVKRYVVAYREGNDWQEYELKQQFGSLKRVTKQEMLGFVRGEMPRRILGNCCILLCGEINGVKYSSKSQRVHDVYGLRKAIPGKVTAILNPVHDRMTRFEMKRKRSFLSGNGRCIISVWNKGKTHKDGKIRDGNPPSWEVFRNGNLVNVTPLQNQFGVEIGILNI